ncbi:hypothetical protein T01_15240 [Trichinella spiralis]|uniref:Uncharacterized protein n=1 Tax=Trichinella spiralis TaxID=6334 RepID=A0A0V1AL00_TRISP|nr:hypothetical protein T01_15240 [Trichinella spiralis]
MPRAFPQHPAPSAIRYMSYNCAFPYSTQRRVTPHTYLHLCAIRPHSTYLCDIILYTYLHNLPFHFTHLQPTLSYLPATTYLPVALHLPVRNHFNISSSTPLTCIPLTCALLLLCYVPVLYAIKSLVLSMNSGREKIQK